MAFDGFFVRKMVRELEESIVNGRINKVNNLSTDEFIFSVRKGKNLKLFVSANPSSSRIQLTNNSYENPSTPSNFCSVLRKYLTGGIILEINQLNNDRIIIFKIKNFDDLGYEKYYYLITELMGKHSNIILTNEENIILESLKNSYSLEYKRSTISNMAYTLPPTIEKINPFEFDEYSNFNFENEDKRFLMKNFYGVSALLNNYFKKTSSTELKDSFVSFCRDFDSYYKPVLIEENGKKDFYFFNVKEFSKEFESLSQLLDYYYMDIAKESINKNTDRNLFNFIKAKLNRLNKKIEILTSELEQAYSRDDYKLKGQLLISNIYLFKREIPEIVTLQNFYSEDLSDIEIELDPNLTIEKNSEKYFNLYKKNKRTIENLIEQIDIAKKDIEYFETIKFQLENADKTDIAEIKDNLQNDAITNKLARRDYLWFHAKDIPGSHVVIFDNNPGEDTIEVASMLAAYYSKFKNEEYVNVDRTLIKNVKKITGAKPGLVTYTGQKTVKQKIDKVFIGQLLTNDNN